VFCPECGTEERQSNQFCRACGIDLRKIRTVIETPDGITASAISARDEIGSAVAAKIREMQDADDLKRVAEDVLPQIEKFLESPAEKRLRRMRLGTTVSSVGFGVAIALTMVALATAKGELMLFAGFGFIAFCIGMGFIINGIFLSVPKKIIADRSADADRQRQLDDFVRASDRRLNDQPAQFSSVTEHTTKHLTSRSSE